MKRFLTILLATLALTGVLCVSASASSFDGAARELSKIGMLKGTAGGFDLDKVPTRAQAAIMLVRLYGAEERAQNLYASGRITCPFTDVNATAAPYVAWLVDEGLANGVTETTFGASDPCTAKAYTIFLLRALGYKDKEDFTTANAQEFALSLGLLDTSSLTGSFLRDDLVALTYQALGTDMKDGKTYLLDHLIKETEMSANDAYPIVEKIESLRAINAASESMQKGMSAKVDMSADLTVSTVAPGDTQPSGNIEQGLIAVKGDIKTVMGKYPQMSLDFTVDAAGESENIKAWLKGDWMYVQIGDETVKMELGEQVAELLKTSAEKNSNASILPFLDDVTKKTSGNETTYTMTLNDSFQNLINGIMAQALQMSGVPAGAAGELDMQGFTMTYTVRGGTLKKISADTAMSITVREDEAQGTTTLGMIMELNVDIAASGSAVKISFPDFSKFKEVIGGADGFTGISGSLVA